MAQRKTVQNAQKKEDEGEFIQLRLRGQGFYPEEDDRTLDKQRGASEDEIKAYTSDIAEIERFKKGARKVLRTQDAPCPKLHRTTRVEPRYLCKIKYICKQRQPFDLTQLVYLMADTNLLFSLDYQIRGRDRKIYREWWKQSREEKANVGENASKDESTVKAGHKKSFEHYHRCYKIREIQGFKITKKRIVTLKNSFEKLSKWQMEGLPSIPTVDPVPRNRKDGNLSDVQYQEIYQATIEYLTKMTKMSDAAISNDSLSRIVASWYYATKEEQTFPFYYMVVCTAEKSRLFTSSEDIDHKIVANYLEKNVYMAKRSKAQQRVDRIRFMIKLIEILKLPPEGRTDNWKLYLKTHGACIDSVEEEELWMKIIQEDDKNSKKGCEIPPIEIQILCRQCLEECLPIEPDRLYSYSAACPRLWKGGYANFFKTHEPTIKKCVTYLTNSRELSRKSQHYLKYWSATKVDLPMIRKFCDDMSKQIPWPTIERRSACNLKQFCCDLFATGTGNNAKIKKCVHDLKILITETAMRIVLANQARDILRENINNILNDHKNLVNYKIEISANLKRIGAPEVQRGEEKSEGGDSL